MEQWSFIAATETMGAVKMYQVPEVVFGQVLIDNFYQPLVPSREAGAAEAYLNINLLIHLFLSSPGCI